MGNTLYSNIGHSTTNLDDIYCKYVNNLYNIYNYLFKYEHFFFMNTYTLNNFYHVLEGINNNEGHVLIKICKLKNEAHKIKRILYTIKFLFSFDLFPNVLPYNRMSVYENNIYIYRRFIFKNLDQYLSNEKNNCGYFFFIFQIFLSVIQLHSLGIYHGHIKSENFLIQNNIHILITDINILNNYLYFIPKIRYKNKRKGRLKRLQEDIFNLGLLILEILLKDKNISYLFVNGNYDDNDDNFYRGTKNPKKLYFIKDSKQQKFNNFNLSKKNSENFFHALSLPVINKRIKNEEYDYFQKNKNLKMNIDKYRYYNYHYINNINYINIYNDIYNNVTSYSVIENNTENFSYENNEILKSKTSLYNNEIDVRDDTHAYSDFDILNEKKDIKNNVSHNLNFHKKYDLFSDNSYMLLNNLKKRKNKKNKKCKNNKTVPHKIWKVVNLVKNPFIIYSLINHFFLQKNNNIFKIFNYWSYYVFPSTFKYIFFPLSILQLHPLFKNSNFFILLIHFNLPFILFYLDIFSEKEKEKYMLLKLITNSRHDDHCENRNFSTPDKNHTYKDPTDKDNKSNYKKLFYYKNVVNSFTTSVNKHQMRTYIIDTNLNNQIKKQILQQWINYKKEKKKEKKKCYHSKSYFPFPIFSYKNTHSFYKNFLEFYKLLYYCIFYKEKSYMDVFNCLEYYKKNIYLPLFNDFYFKKSVFYKNEKSHKWSFNEDIYKLVNIIISSYNSISYESVKLLAIEIIYCIIYHISDSALNIEIVSFLLYCFNNSTEKIKIIILKCFYKIIDNANTYEHMYMYVEKFLPKFYLLKNSENYEKYFYAKYLPLFSYITIQYIYNASLLKNKNKNIKNILSEVKYMEILNEIRNQLVFLLNCSNGQILYEFYENICRFCKIMNKKWVKIYILPYLLSNIYNSENKFIRAMCAKTTIRVIFYINKKQMYKKIFEYIKPLFFEKNDLILEFILCECNLILKKNYKKYNSKNQKVWIFFKKIRLNHLLDHPSCIIRNLVQALKKNLQKNLC